MHFTPLDKVKVLLLGQDPYHNVDQAHGLSFSVLPSQTKIPPSLQNIYKELKSDLDCSIPNNGYLKKWADQGVLLLNTVLTVRAHQANSHQGRDGRNLQTLLFRRSMHRTDRLYICCGENQRRKKIPMLTNPKHLILKALYQVHCRQTMDFSDAKHFSQANEFLKANGVEPIDWQIENI